MEQSVKKIFQLVRIGIYNRQEFTDRINIIIDRIYDNLFQFSLRHKIITEQLYPTEIHHFEDFFGNLSRETPCRDIENIIREHTAYLKSNSQFALIHNADLALARFCYAACRFLRPQIVVETGVAYGVTSAFILQALEVNNNGVLHSIDLPPLAPEANYFVGVLIPEHLKHRWHLHRGSSRRILPRLLRDLTRVDIFVHDSLHTRRNMIFELSTVTPYLARPSFVIADDVNMSTAFLEWVERAHPNISVIVREQEKNACFGIAFFDHSTRQTK